MPKKRGGLIIMNEKQVSKILLEVKAITLSPKEPYTFVSGIKSPIYCDNRLLMSYPKQREAVVGYFLDAIKASDLNFDVVAGTATAGISWAAWVADKHGKPMIYIRGEKKEHGKENRIEGKLEEGQRVLVLEDLISTGGSSFSAVEAVREAGGIVDYCVAIFTYEMEKAKNKFAEGKCELIALSNFSTLVATAAEGNYIDNEQKENVLEWNKAPAEWGKKMGFE